MFDLFNLLDLFFEAAQNYYATDFHSRITPHSSVPQSMPRIDCI